MISTKAYRMHIYPDNDQKRKLDNIFNGLTYVYNKCVEEGKRSYIETEGTQYILPDVEYLQNEYKWLRTIPTHILYQSRLNVSEKFIDLLSHKLIYGLNHMPHFHSRNRNISMSYIDKSYSYFRFAEMNKKPCINIPSIGYVCMYKSPLNKIMNFIKSNNLKMYSTFIFKYFKITRSSSGDYFATLIFQYEDNVNEYDYHNRVWWAPSVDTLNCIAINDIKLNDDRILCNDSDGVVYHVPAKMKMKRYNHVMKLLKRSKYGSKRSMKYLCKLNIITERNHQLAVNASHGIASYYANQYDVCFITIPEYLYKKSPSYELHILLRKQLMIDFIRKGSKCHMLCMENRRVSFTQLPLHILDTGRLKLITERNFNQ